MVMTVSDLHRYFRQQQEQYGDLLYVEHEVLRRVTLASQGLVEDNGRVGEMWKTADSLDALHAMICDCHKCPLGDTRTRFVFGVGNPSADVVIVGEAPGAEEDKKGEPFVGRAGQLLNDILKAIHFSREEVFICNILKCRPPNNRDPLASEVEQCEPYLHKQLELLQPKILLALGRIAAQTLLRTNDSLTKLRASVHEYHGIPLVVTYHPAALLRNPNWKRPTWEDVQKFRALYDSLAGGEKR
jgi:uracil-DNA glycosylase